MTSEYLRPERLRGARTGHGSAGVCGLAHDPLASGQQRVASVNRATLPGPYLRRSSPPIGALPYFITLPAYGFYWFLLAEEVAAPSWHEPHVPPLPEFLTLVAYELLE